MPIRRQLLRRILVAALMAAAVLALGGAANGAADEPPKASTPAPAPPAADSSARGDTLAARDVIQPAELAHLIAGPASHRPALLHVGFKVLYRSGHITGSKYAGPASKPEGLASLEQVLRPRSRQAPIVLYCGCCPWQDCPNVHPALRMAHAMGFKNVKVLFVAKNMQNDWIDPGYPTSEGEP